MSAPVPANPPRVVAVASAGGHWVQLLRMRPAFAGADVTWVTTRASLARQVEGKLHVVADASRSTPFRLVWMVCQLFWLMLRLRPHVVITTGAAPGAVALVFGRLFFARTIWIDSIANGEVMSRSGRLVRPFAKVWLTQWPNLSKPEGPDCWGSVV